MERHRIDAVSLVAGVIFVAIGLLALLDVSGLAAGFVRYWPFGLVLAGLALLAGVRRRVRDR